VPGKDNLPAMVEGKNLLARAEMQATALGVAFEGVLVSGNIPEAILTVAARIQCDLIILGTRGLAGWKRLMVGSIANAVMAKSVSPVLIVKHFDAV
jgi:nucleotide-binding universal stress UspA family protein